MKQKIVSLIVFALMLGGCGSESNSQFDNDFKTLYYDYYEIADDTIVYTKINEDPLNVLYLQNSYLSNDTNYLVMHEEYFENFNLVNTTLDKNETLCGWKVDYLNTFTNKSLHIFIKDNHGLYAISTNFCTINSAIPNCQTVIYTRYE